MNKPVIFTGAGIAIITPFKNNQVDFEAYGRIIDDQIARGTDAIVACGTTGEASTLTDEEHRACIRYAVERVAGRVPVVAGTGSNDTDYSVGLSKYAFEVGADAVLLVTPYYNKATPKGMIKNFNTIANAVKKPCILYNVPSRTGCNITTAVYKELAKNEYIVGTKEASGNLSAIAQMRAECGDDLAVYSGNDDQIVPILSLGGKGVISVLSHVVPKETHDIVSLYLEGKVKESCDLQLKLMDLINDLFIEVNPIPVKTAMGLLGMCSDELRLPLCEMEEGNKAKLIATMKKHGLL
ncbi:MAG: 4-hydroxy-tetrahydrodipicolinate synthase [Ruminococcaceae bacterium]|nr:4-hydroxy-tetrahydrodipicolinate synthase [Oscillospiraceae bacterium]